MARVGKLDGPGGVSQPQLVEAGFQPAGQGGILPPGWEAGLTGSQRWLPPRFMAVARGNRAVEAAKNLKRTLRPVWTGSGLRPHRLPLHSVACPGKC